MKNAQPSYVGKVRDLYDLGNQLVIVSTDRISAFDVVFKEGIAERGEILTRISNRWFNYFKDIPNHIIETDVEKMPSPFCDQTQSLKDRTILVKKGQRIDFECIVRGYLMGSGYEEYKKTGTVCGVEIPPGLKKGEKLPEPIFTPSTKSDKGHDENVSYEFMAEHLGKERSEELKETSLKIFSEASAVLQKNGIILADTKFEFALDEGQLILIDEILTPDSSRYCKKEEYDQAMKSGNAIPSMDKQIIRDYILTLDWDKNPPPPPLPAEILEKALEKYREIERIIECALKEM
ncbi:MAG: phosphoribosylaminoimidazolesuccinocarboxamide synthase [Leptospirales bacterium]